VGRYQYKNYFLADDAGIQACMRDQENPKNEEK
jgi:hypothetical protein